MPTCRRSCSSPRSPACSARPVRRTTRPRTASWTPWPATGTPPAWRRPPSPGARRAAEAGSGAATGLRQRLAGLPAAEQDRVLLEVVAGHAAAVLGHADSSAVDPNRAFQELGFDSLTAVEFRNRLSAATGKRLS